MSGHEHADAVLAHYGVKGMKWGKRKAANLAEAEKVVSTKKANSDPFFKELKGAVDQLSKAQYEGLKKDLRAEAFIATLFNDKNNTARAKLALLEGAEKVAAKGEKWADERLKNKA